MIRMRVYIYIYIYRYITKINQTYSSPQNIAVDAGASMLEDARIGEENGLGVRDLVFIAIPGVKGEAFCWKKKGPRVKKQGTFLWCYVNHARNKQRDMKQRNEIKYIPTKKGLQQCKYEKP